MRTATSLPPDLAKSEITPCLRCIARRRCEQRMQRIRIGSAVGTGTVVGITVTALILRRADIEDIAIAVTVLAVVTLLMIRMASLWEERWAELRADIAAIRADASRTGDQRFLDGYLSAVGDRIRTQ